MASKSKKVVEGVDGPEVAKSTCPRCQARNEHGPRVEGELSRAVVCPKCGKNYSLDYSVPVA